MVICLVTGLKKASHKVVNFVLMVPYPPPPTKPLNDIFDLLGLADED